jgi:hypothetical protein
MTRSRLTGAVPIKILSTSAASRDPMIQGTAFTTPAVSQVRVPVVGGELTKQRKQGGSSGRNVAVIPLEAIAAP